MARNEPLLLWLDGVSASFRGLIPVSQHTSMRERAIAHAVREVMREYSSERAYEYARESPRIRTLSNHLPALQKAVAQIPGKGQETTLLASR